MTLPKDVVANPVLARWVSVRADGLIDVRVGKVELGQGIITALAQVAADELGVDLARIRMRPANTAVGPNEGVTAGSMSVQDSGAALRVICANVRALFAAEADRRGIPLSYAELAETVGLNREADPSVEPRGGRLSGTSAARLDLPDKVAGRPRYVHDIRLPGMMFGRVIRPPSPGARLTTFEAPAGVQVVRNGSFLAVVGEDEAAVERAAARIRARWDEKDTLPDEDDLSGYLRAGPHETTVVLDDGEPPPAVGTALRATYSRPFLAHASIAPSCAVARWGDGGTLSVWSHSQGIYNLRDAIAAALDLDPAAVTVEHAEGAGSYGHNPADDVAFDAVLVARAVPGRPVQVRWSRADELSWGPFGSAMTADLAATLDGGRLTSWSCHVYSQGHTSRPGYAGVPGLLSATLLDPPASYPAAVDPPAASGAGSARNAVPGYDVGHRRIVTHRLTETPIRSSAIRSLGAFLNVFAIESFMDECAAAAGRDPLDFRLAHLADERGRRVLEAAAKAAGWGGPPPPGTGRGIGYARYKGRGAYCAVVAEVEAEHEIRVRRLTVAVDVGLVVNPDGVRNQIEGGATQATSWALKERVRFDRRRVTSLDWESYPILRFSEAPEVAVEVVANPDAPSVGAGEAAQGPTAGAIANAVADALGVRVRDLPLTAGAVIRAIEVTS